MNKPASAKVSHTKRLSVHKGFKSPLLSRTPDNQIPTSSTSSSDNQEAQQKTPLVLDNRSPQHPHQWDTNSLQKEVDDLKQQLHEVQQQIQNLRDSGLNESELEDHIAKLHEYNEIKDVAQMVLGHIATLQGVRTKDVYAQYQLNLDD